MRPNRIRKGKLKCREYIGGETVLPTSERGESLKKCVPVMRGLLVGSINLAFRDFEVRIDLPLKARMRAAFPETVKIDVSDNIK